MATVLCPLIYTQTIPVFGDVKFEAEFLVEDSIVPFETRSISVSARTPKRHDSHQSTDSESTQYRHV